MISLTPRTFTIMDTRKFVAFLLFVATLGTAWGQLPEIQWGLTGSGNKLDRLTGIGMDALGNTYMTGIFEDSMAIDNGSQKDKIKGGGFRDIFLAKYDPSGNKVWAHGFGVRGWDYPWSLATDPAGGVYMGGVFFDSVNFDPAGGNGLLISNQAGFWTDGYIAKYDDNGNLTWAKHLKTARNRNASQSAVLFAMHAMDVDPAGNLIIGGALWDSVWFSPNDLIVSQTALRDMFLAKYDPNGNLIWVKLMGASSDQQINDLAVDSNGDIVVTGWIIGSVDLDPGMGTNTVASQGEMDPFVAKYSANGDHLWGFGLGSAAAGEEGRGVDVDGAGNVYITGRIRDDIDFDPGPGTQILSFSGGSDLYVAKYDPQGNFSWVFGLDGGTSEMGEGIDVQPNGDFTLIGKYGTPSGFDLDPGPDTVAIFNLAGGEDVFVARYDAMGNFQYGFDVRGLDDDNITSVASVGNEIVAGGWFERTILIDRTTGDLRFARGPSNMWVVRFGPGTTGFASLRLRQDLKAYPNPAKEVITLSADWGSTMKATLQLRDVTGRLVNTVELSPANKLNHRLNVASLPAGSYFVELILPMGKQVQPFFKN
jgi:hypothetical protein